MFSLLLLVESFSEHFSEISEIIAFESPIYAILLNGFYFSVFTFMEKQCYQASIARGYIKKCAELKTLQIFMVD